MATSTVCPEGRRFFIFKGRLVKTTSQNDEHQEIVFRRSRLDEFDSAYTIVCEAVAWLQQKGYEHWLIPSDIYRERQRTGENYGLFVNGELAAVMTLCLYEPGGWDDVLPQGKI